MEAKQIVEREEELHHPEPHPSHSAEYEALLQAGPRLRPLQQAHAQLVVTGRHRNRSLLTKLLGFACVAGSVAYARRLFFSVPKPDSFLFNTLINSTSKHGLPHEALFFYCHMLLSVISPSSYTFTSVIKSSADLSGLRVGRSIHSHALVWGFGSNLFVEAALVAFYAKSNDLRAARKVFDRMSERNVVSWNSMITGYQQNGVAKEAISMFHRMLESGFVPDSATFVGVLSACSQLGESRLGSWVYDCIVVKGIHIDVFLGTSLVNMFSRCGNVSKAREVFDLMTERNVHVWTAMISAYGTHGYGSQAMELFHEMRANGPTPNTVTFVAVLSACEHAGLVHQGRQAFAIMTEEYGLVPEVEHHVAMVDMFGRAGLLDEAYQFIQELDPKEKVPAIWTSMLGACKMHKNLDIGVTVAEHLLSLEPENPGHYVMLSNIFAAANRMDRVELVRNMMIERGIKKKVGYSTIHIDGKTYLFSMGDKSHPETIKIYQYLDELIWKCKGAGYIPAAESALHEVEEEEREHALRYHSEKLAIAFGLMKTNQDVAITIVKNLRMCEDCHSAIKFISLVSNREIIVRDKLRFHHFANGSCSCSDYW